ncbi:uncharacterized protein BT62DRAFT_933736 [Guyanagaster necrorhizus]|uniref:Uncharacterized protein n=1 Tax=Guyanagaster necrorhizus TaxID=856835 RepID=A0A9P7VNY1_9AGAR|nr:uncharacterized protein BT62DRAFT_933736 [Guyanagaster necrorhizus MCA 3950]KAG7444691.1 hypothetical protein BT62DRAFT_933736 [Guyanagaster necrorhizus MCA 3950]
MALNKDAFPSHDQGCDPDAQAQVQDIPHGQVQEVPTEDNQSPICRVHPPAATEDEIEPPWVWGPKHTLLLREPEEPSFPPDNDDPDPLLFVDPWDFLLVHSEGLPHPNSEPPPDSVPRLGSFDFELAESSSLELDPSPSEVMLYCSSLSGSWSHA